MAETAGMMPRAATPRRRRATWWVVALGVALLVALGLGVVAFQPWTANHFGYALPGRDGLPYRIVHGGRYYGTQQVCAGAGWCRTAAGAERCVTAAELARRGAWPLVPAGSLPTLFGAARPIFTPSGAAGSTAPLIIPDGADCYVEYGLEDGPYPRAGDPAHVTARLPG